MKHTISLGLRSTTSLLLGFHALYATSPALTGFLSMTMPLLVTAGTLAAPLLRSLSRGSHQAYSDAMAKVCGAGRADKHTHTHLHTHTQKKKKKKKKTTHRTVNLI
jgi:hypothetical protein